MTVFNPQADHGIKNAKRPVIAQVRWEKLAPKDPSAADRLCNT